MSENNSDDLTLVHEDYISDNGIDETTLSASTLSKISAIDAKISAYDNMDEDDETLSEVEAQIEAASVDIMNDIIAEQGASNSGSDDKKGGDDSKKDDADDKNKGNDPDKSKEKKKDAPKKESNPFFDMLGLGN
jgi:hypothetical protein